MVKLVASATFSRTRLPVGESKARWELDGAFDQAGPGPSEIALISRSKSELGIETGSPRCRGEQKRDGVLPRLPAPGKGRQVSMPFPRSLFTGCTPESRILCWISPVCLLELSERFPGGRTQPGVRLLLGLLCRQESSCDWKIFGCKHFVDYLRCAKWQNTSVC